MRAERGRQKPRAEMSAAMLEHIEERGSLKRVSGSPGGKLTLMKVAISRKESSCGIRWPTNMN